MIANKILILGSPCSGKTTFSKSLGNILNIKVYSLDWLFWRPNWKKTSKSERISILKELYKNEKQWIIEGNYNNVLEYQLKHSKTVILLNFSRYTCLVRLLKKKFSHIIGKRFEVAPGCMDKIDWKYIKSIWLYPSRDLAVLNTIIENSKCSFEMILLNNPSDLNIFMDKI